MSSIHNILDTLARAIYASVSTNDNLSLVPIIHYYLFYILFNTLMLYTMLYTSKHVIPKKIER